MAFDAYALAKWAHVLFAIVAVGFNATYGVLIARASREPQHLPHVLRTVKVMDDRFANPAYALLLVTGLSMLWLGGLSLRTLWLGASLALYVVAVALGLLVYTPTLRRQIAEVERAGASAEYRRLATRGAVVGAILAVDVVAIVVLMVAKPVAA